jgi:hypothetical protein
VALRGRASRNERILTVNEAIREEAFVGFPARRDVLIDVLGHIKSNLALKEEVACDRSGNSSRAAVVNASGD